jgi:hypothetical protein
LIANAITWLGKSDGSARADWTTRDLLALSPKEAAQQLVSPFDVKTTAEAGQPLAASLNQVGIWQFTAPSGVGAANEAVVPVNLLDPAESNLGTQAKTLGRIPKPLLPDPGPLWSWLTALALVWVIGMWVLFQGGVLE